MAFVLPILFACLIGQLLPERHSVDPNVPVQISVSRVGELETFWTLPGKIKVEDQTFKVWRNTLILCGAKQDEKRNGHVED